MPGGPIGEPGIFIAGWSGAGGTGDDAETDCSWFTPWVWSPEITVHGTTPAEWGVDWYRQCKPEINAILDEFGEE